MSDPDWKGAEATISTSRRSVPPGRALRITVEGASDARRSIITERSATIGRGSGATLQLVDLTASAYHVEVSVVGDGISVRDLRSRNGTFFAGARIVEAVVPPGSSIKVGDSTLTLELAAAPVEGEPEPVGFADVVGESPPMRELFGLLTKIAPTHLSVLIEAPTGAGKELVARGLHAQGLRPNGPFVVLDCTSVPPTLAEAILFGHERGAFTGATTARAGLFEAADGGTVFLDEVGDLPAELQPKLLRVLERREVVRLGTTTPRRVDARVVSATWRDLRVMVNEGTFREDLYYRLAQLRMRLPALSERRDDIPLLVRHFLARLPEGPVARAISDAAMTELMNRAYPGNVRELKNVVERAAALADGPAIDVTDLAFERRLSGDAAPIKTPLPPPSSEKEPLVPFKDAKRTVIEEFEREYLGHLIARSNGNLSQAASLARIERHYLRDRLRRYGLRITDE